MELNFIFEIADDEEREKLAREISKDWSSGKSLH